VGAPIEQRVREHARRHALLPEGEPVLALVSGGADSMCLMHVLAAVHDGPVMVLSVDHGLRPEAAAESAAVVAAARALGLRAQVESLSLEPGAAVQERAREARLGAAHALADELGCARIATGHTLSDQAETVLFRLARGAGRAGALGIAPRNGRLVRPLGCLTAAEARAWCERNGVAWIEDPGNADRRFARARVRHDLMPALEAVHPGAARNVAAFADMLRDEAEVLEVVVEAAWHRCAGASGLRADAVRAEPAALARLLVRRALAEAGLPAEARETAVVERVLALTERVSGRREIPGGWVELLRGELIAGPVAPAAPAAATLAVPGRAAFGRLRLTATPGRAEPATPDRQGVLAAGPLVVRPPAPGDRVAMSGGGHKRVGRLLAEAGVPVHLRPEVPVVVAGERVVWVAGHRADAELAAAPGEAATILSVAPA
jgi:tRNA(Ile)-lysidine synthase